MSIELSKTSSVRKETVTVFCNCVTCQYPMIVKIETDIVILNFKVISFKTPKQGDFHCPNCNSTYVRWGAMTTVKQQ